MAKADHPKWTRRAVLEQAAAAGIVAVSPAFARVDPGRARASTTGGAAAEMTTLPPLSLRGYGTLAAAFRRVSLPEGPGSVLQITAETPQKARLTHAKYLSDAQTLPGVKAARLQVSADAAEILITGRCAIAAFTADNQVVVLMARTQRDLTALLHQYVPAGTPSKAFQPQAEIPMYLDRFDKHGLLSYYIPFREPPQNTGTAPYDVAKDFDFAAENNIGLVLWDNETLNDSAEGLANLAGWRWAEAQSRARKLPLHINTSCGSALWLTNRYRGETMQKQPQYCGSDYRIGEADIGAVGTLSWAAEEGADVELGVLQDTVRSFVGHPEVVGWLEPHGEADVSPLSLLVEFGEVADRSMRRYLQTRYASPVDLSQAWFGDSATITAWDHVHIPELAAFLGWGADAIDLTGEWKIAYPAAPDGHAYTREEAHRFGNRPTPTVEIPAAWYQPDFDDRRWGSLTLPGNDRQMFLVRAPAIIRRSITVSADWLAQHPRHWLYLWDLSDVTGESYPLYVNGQPVPMQGSAQPHWGVAQLTGVLKDGTNFIALRLPKGLLAYRCYIAPSPPAQYPALGPPLNARWADFVGWSRSARGAAIRRGTQMIRQVDPERPINFMHPDTYLDLVGDITAEFGGHFHNTGYMAGFWSEYNPIVARGLGRPCSAEPGSAATTAVDFQAFWGRWLTEGIQSVHYFQHLGDIQWNPEVRRCFTENRALYDCIGKYHVPQAEVAILYGLRSNSLTSWPWGLNPDTNLAGGYWSFNTAYALLGVCPRDGVTEASFENGTVAKYRVIIDSNTSIMSDAMIAGIERYVRAGGTFVTFGQTGRHTPMAQDSWPISALTGYRVQRIDKFGDGNWPRESHPLTLAPRQTVFTASPWEAGVRASGLALAKVAADVEDLMLWDDGSVAAGMRTLGSGRVIHLGILFEALADRTSSPRLEALLSQIIDHLQIARVPARAAHVMFRHYISNNGLYDLWMVFNDSGKSVTTDLIFSGSHPPQSVLEIKSMQWSPVDSRQGSSGVFGLALDPMETRLLLSWRTDFELAPLEWLKLQRDWWAGTAAAPTQSLPTPAQDQRHSVDVTDDWTFRIIDGVGDGAIAKLAGHDTDDTSWERRPLGLWGIADHADGHRALLRRVISVPAAWTDGEIHLWLRSWFSYTYHDRARVFIDGRLFRDFSADGVAGTDVTALFRPGSSHLIALDIEGKNALRGVDGSAWLYHIPAPAAQLDLGGRWALTSDGVQPAGTAALPGLMKALFAERTFRIEADQAHRNAVVYIDAEGPVFGVLINGAMICRHHHMIGRVFCIDVTPKVQFGRDNRLELVTKDAREPCRIHAIELRFYERGTYP